ncbi:MAG: DNA/RNA nuclease SfsA [Deltaproteobacteria bacterium]|nr:DNA/RNA nuclease SfsA [Deltaproteobacteria bacterium]
MAFLPFSSPHQGKLIKRYKRFLVDVLLEGDDEVTTAHTSNTGAMTGLLEEGNDALLTYHDVKTRKLKYGLEALRTADAWVGVNTHLANKIVKEVFVAKELPAFAGYDEVKAEKKVEAPLGHTSRIDFFLSGHPDLADAFVEVKSVTLREGTTALFPDAVSERGKKHLQALMDLKSQGFRVVMLYLVQRVDCERFAPAFNVDKAYCQTLIEAVEQGVEIFALRCEIDKTGVRTKDLLPICLDENAL